MQPSSSSIRRGQDIHIHGPALGRNGQPELLLERRLQHPLHHILIHLVRQRQGHVIARIPGAVFGQVDSPDVDVVDLRDQCLQVESAGVPMVAGDIDRRAVRCQCCWGNADSARGDSPLRTRRPPDCRVGSVLGRGGRGNSTNKYKSQIREARGPFHASLYSTLPNHGSHPTFGLSRALVTPENSGV